METSTSPSTIVKVTLLDKTNDKSENNTGESLNTDSFIPPPKETNNEEDMEEPLIPLPEETDNEEDMEEPSIPLPEETDNEEDMEEPSIPLPEETDVDTDKIDLIESLEKNNKEIVPLRQTGGMDKKIFNELTDNFSKTDDDLDYVKTNEYINNIRSEDYNDYLKDYELFYKDQLVKSNLTKYTFQEKRHMLEKLSSKTNVSIQLPVYEDVYTILDYIENEMGKKEYTLKHLRDILLLNYNDTSYKDFDKTKKEYITLLKQRDIYTTYINKLNTIDELKLQKITLIEKRRQLKLKLYSLSFEMKETNDKDKINELSKIYIELNTISALDKEISEINEALLNLNTTIILQPPIIKKGKGTIKPDIKETVVTEKIVEEVESTPDSPKIPKKLPLKIKVKKSKIKEKPTEEPKLSNIEAGVIDANKKKRRKVTGKPVVAGKCIFPFKHGKKYIKEEDGCVKTKDGGWCATSVDKDPDYEWKTMGFCEDQG
jgi:hypothetical protein